jgi:hypothetical protein
LHDLEKGQPDADLDEKMTASVPQTLSDLPVIEAWEVSECLRQMLG